eukprot:CAMPEP_0170448048 /NCGR_PEP_ID=MMETSP0117_2-20130122/50498_1 /TAXON_ID=400756 /ORGANISM="Durinskia baltica, Strain CSIRO CS-38" /LENGTH=268 /DNA_ID=CAMNT_0010709187 /DNA_START=63 /DNA_END=869 /DNA_ORIENTATION=-
MTICMLLFQGIFMLYIGTELSHATVPSVNVIIARYKEPLVHLRWLHHIPHIIYSREKESITDTDVLNTVFQPINVGREGWIYADHIVQNYNNLSDINIFSQAENPGREIIFRKYTEDLFSGAVSVETLNGFAYLGTQCLTVRSGMGSVAEVREKYNISATAYERSQEGMYEIISKIIMKTNLPPQDNLRFNPNGLFAVSKESILSNPISYYIRLRDVVLGDGDQPYFKNEGIVLERSWAYVFNSECSHKEIYQCALNHPDVQCEDRPP